MALALRCSRLATPSPLLLLTRRLSTAATTKVSEIASDAEYNSITEGLENSGKLAVVDYTAKWCGPCRMVAPLLDELSLKNPEVAFYKIDIDNPAMYTTVSQAGISAVPTFIIMKGKQRVDMFTGASIQLLQDLIKKHQ